MSAGGDSGKISTHSRATRIAAEYVRPWKLVTLALGIALVILGFVTDRFVEASSSAETEERAIAQIRCDPKPGKGLLNERDNPPVIVADEIVEVDADTVPEIRRGFAFFPAENDA